MSNKKYEVFEHTADIGLRGFGKTIEEAFENAAFGMFNIMYRRLDKVKPKQAIEVVCSAYDLESLFIEWLNSLLSKSDLYNIVFSEFKIKSLNQEKYQLQSMVKGENFKKDFEPAIEVKAATYSGLKIEKKGKIYIAQCILDV